MQAAPTYAYRYRLLQSKSGYLLQLRRFVNGLSPRTSFILSAVTVVTLIAATIIGLTIGLRTPPLENGGSPEWPQNDTTTLPYVSTTPEPSPPTFPPSEMTTTRFTAVSTDAPLCSEVGTVILARHGGSAVDAAIASLLCMGILNRHSMGIGGGFFMTIYAVPNGENEKRMVTLLSREKAPAAATEDMYVNNTDASYAGGLAIGVPGEVAGYHAAWRMFGKVPWADLFDPTIAMLRDGYPVSRSMANALEEKQEIIKADENLKVFLGEDGDVLKEGDLAYDTTFASTLERIANDSESFYNGSLAEDIVQDISDYDGIITTEDMAGYSPKFRDTLNVTLQNGNLTVYAPPPPSSGAILQFILGVLDGYNFDNRSIQDVESRVLSYHRMVEAFKFAYAKRSALGDEDFVDVNELVAKLTSSDYAHKIRLRISDVTTHNVSYYEPAFDFNRESGTSHMNVLAGDGSAVSVTSTINTYFGSMVRGPRTGIVFNNEMDDFSTPGTVNSFGIPASPANYIVPGKMPMSSMCPAIVLDGNGNVIMLTGAAGGSRITTTAASVAVHNLWFGERVDQATDEPRFHHQLVPDYIQYEADFNEDILRGLAEKGHALELKSGYMSVVTSIHNTCPTLPAGGRGLNCVNAVSDGRKGGWPDGY